jgi:hypothetical protein
VKGLYAKARAGEIKNFTGIDSVEAYRFTPELGQQPGAQTAGVFTRHDWPPRLRSLNLEGPFSRGAPSSMWQTT